MLLTVLHIIVLTIALLCLHLTYILPKTVERSVLYAVRLFLFVVFAHNIHAFVLGDLLVGYQYVDWAAPYGLLYGPMLYVGPITIEKVRHQNLKLFLHGLPFVIALFFYIIMLFSFEYRETYGIKHYMFLYTGIGASLFVYSALLFKNSTRGSHRLMPVYAAIGMLIALIILIQKIGEFFLLPDGYSVTMSVLCYTGVLCALLIIYGESLHVLRSAANRKEDQSKIDTPVSSESLVAEEPRLSAKEVWEPYVEQVESYMQHKKYLDFSFDIVTMSTDLKIPKYILNELFSHYYQKSFVKKINNLRVQYACKELENTDFDQNIDQLWKSCGFKSRASFYRNFSQLMHCTPLAYREKQMLKK